MDRQEFLCTYWNYYLMLERKLEETFNYVELSANNYNTFSNEYAALIQTIGAELDSFFKVYCSFSHTDRKTISDYSNYIFQNEPSVINAELLVSIKRFSLTPFKAWNNTKPSQSLSWWQAFDNIKHSRTINFNDASLINTLNILAALFILESKYLVKITSGTEQLDVPDNASSLFSFKTPISQFLPMNNAFFKPTEL